MLLRKTAALITLLALASCAFAHHGRRFLFVTEFRMPHPGNVYSIVDFSAVRFRSGDPALELEPGLLFEVGGKGRVAFELHSHIEKEGAARWDSEAMGFEFRSRIGGDSSGWNFAGGVEFEAPAHRGPTPISAELIAGKENAAGVWALNLFASDEQGLNGRTAWSYRAGWSPSLAGSIGWSLEAQGGLGRAASHEVALGAAFSFGENRLLKLGIGTGIGPNSPTLTLHAGLVVKMR